MGTTSAAEVETIAETVHDAIASRVFPRHATDSRFDEVLERCVRGNIGLLADVASGRVHHEEPELGHALAFAEVVAEQGLPFEDLERAYWVGLEQFWHRWLAIVGEAAARGDGTVAELIGDRTPAVFGYVTRVLGLVSARYDEVAGELACTGEERRRALVGELLGATPPAHTQFLDDELGYRLRACHLALLLQGDRPHAERRLARLRHETDAQAALLVQRSPGLWAGWLGFPGRVDPATLRTIRQAVSRHGEPVVAGGPALGLAGFRRAHEEAVRAFALREVLADPGDFLWYTDVRLEAFLLGDPAAARRFVAEELGELAEANERADRIRETLLAALASGSQARAAAELGVHENTVRLRIRTATELLGDALSERRTELLVALRLRRALGPQAGSGPMDAVG
ncbi:PucR family transcriptional regulator [Amycolatopsis magusensis]|uniref:PucR family transcriptional regulator n=1 Tax=Amycolatopsis magusensis TaxID=882444 RepID=UPI003C2C5791